MKVIDVDNFTVWVSINLDKEEGFPKFGSSLQDDFGNLWEVVDRGMDGKTLKLRLLDSQVIPKLNLTKLGIRRI